MKVGEKYANRKSGNVVTITDLDDKKGMTVEYLPEGTDKSRLTSMTTFKKSFKLIEEVKSEDAPVDEPKPIETSKEEEPKAEKKEKAPKEKKEKKERKKSDVDTIDVTEEIFKKHGLDYKRTKAGGGIGLFNEGTKILDIWRRSNKIRVYVSSENPMFKSMKSDWIEKLHDNPSKTAKLNKSFYVTIENIETVIMHYAKEAK